MTQSRLPLNSETRLGIALRILKTALLPFVPDTLRAAGEDPLSKLPPSSPVLKHGFELDARDAMRMLNACPQHFASESEASDLRPHIRQLSRLRDLWAHQQPITEAEASRFCKIGAQLLRVLKRDPEALALRALSSEPPDCFGAVCERLNDRTNSFQIRSRDDFMLELDLSPDDADDLIRFQKALVWSAASDFARNRPTLALLVCSDSPGGTRDLRHLPGRSFWWLLGLPYDAPLAARISAYQDWLFLLDPHAGSA